MIYHSLFTLEVSVFYEGILFLNYKQLYIYNVFFLEFKIIGIINLKFIFVGIKNLNLNYSSIIL